MTANTDAARPLGSPSHYSLRAAGDPELPCIGGVGWQTVRGTDYHWDGTRRGRKIHFIFQYTLSGAGAIDIGGRRRRVDPGHCFLVEVPGRHVYYHPAGWPDWEFIYAAVSGACARPLWLKVIQRLGPVCAVDPPSEAVAIIKGLYARAAAGQYVEPLENAELASRFLLALLGAEAEGRAPAGGAVSRAAAWARENLSSGASVKGMARAAGLSRHHFARVFHRRTGISPVDYLTRLRLRRAAAMLREDAAGLEEVAAAAGFGSSGYMCRVFRKLTGHTPGEVRRSPALAADILTRPL
ncbi:MAG: AraC family transcriptional regulator [Planctomycetota bacterium]|jgi:AraC-like DNA-binding protein